MAEASTQADRLDLPEDEIHVWVADHRVGPDELEAYSALLDPDERRRASRFRFDKDFRRFVFGHGRVRSLLGRYCGGRPDALRIARRCGLCGSEEHGKPYLLRASGAPSTLRFSYSYSDRMVVVAVCKGTEVGVDVERVDVDFAWRQIAETALSRGEISHLETLDGAGGARGFYDVWTRKEAVSKASGRGLSQLMEMDTRGWAYRDDGRFEVVEGLPPRSWVGKVLDVPEHAAAVAVERVGAHEWSLKVNPAGEDV